ncbi:hypothetical protein [Pukyongiella litopenaei]|uniref:Lipoprotein n=1 Tax=Pukyongiella litopenaei TaxID=2605946 RepID=A0A2S0MLS3_9RHOB|nr:hypothetical protein [Pukyongiella litopenaei]AVO36826.1 hypothetical protein C6Y53_03375 [Pukyongiella litopenaei]
MWRGLIILSLLVGACSAPGRYFADAPVRRLDVAGSVFDVRIAHGLAEAVRVNPQYAPRMGELRTRAAFAIEKASGCDVVQLGGDQAVILGRLDCGDGAAVPPLPGAVSYSCLELNSWVTSADGWSYSEFDCDAY